jgi:hypothetical protein
MKRRMLKTQHYRIKSPYWLIFILMIVGLSACGPADEGSDGNIQTDESGYPAASEVAGYPERVSTVYPVESAYPEPSNIEESERFKIDQPLVPGSTTITGQAPKNLPLSIVDITFAGVVLGSGESGEDGRFSIPVTPLPEGHRIGLTISELGPGQTYEQMSVEYFPYRGEGFMNVPNVGIFFDTALANN